MAMMNDYEYDFCLALHEKLKEKIKGKIFTIIENDILRVEIYMRNSSWAIAWDDFSGKLIDGFLSDNFANVAVKQYRKYIQSRSCGEYFRN